MALVNGRYHYHEEKIYRVSNYIIPPLLREKFIGSNRQHKPRTILANTKEIKEIYGQPHPHVCLSVSLSLSLSPGLCRLTQRSSEGSQITGNSCSRTNQCCTFHILLSFYSYLFNLLHKSVLAHDCYSHLMFHFHI